MADVYLKTLTAFAVWLISSSTLAQTTADSDQVAASFRTASANIPALLLKRGYRSIGKVDLQSLVRQSADVSVVVVDSVELVQVSVGSIPAIRSSAQWSGKNEKQDASIEVDRDAWLKTKSPIRDVLGLHEQLGISGVSDHDYSVSIGLWILSKDSSNSVFSKSERQAIFDDVARSSGGVVGVGGGGDDGGIESKMRFVANEIAKVANMKPAKGSDVSRIEDLLFYLRLQIEVQRTEDPLRGCKMIQALTPQMQGLVFSSMQSDRRLPNGVESLQDLLAVCETKLAAQP